MDIRGRTRRELEASFSLGRHLSYMMAWQAQQVAVLVLLFLAELTDDEKRGSAQPVQCSCRRNVVLEQLWAPESWLCWAAACYGVARPPAQGGSYAALLCSGALADGAATQRSQGSVAA